jgi:adenosylmethionine-8-amino-7-oxononanoate aminotransferase
MKFIKYLSSCSAGDLEITRTEGSSLIFDSNGKRYIDFVSGSCVGNFGWSLEEIQLALKEYNGPAYIPPDHTYQPWKELAQLLAELAPGRLKRSFRATGGTEAVEIALQLAMAHTGRRKFIAIEGGYHGDSIAAESLGNKTHDQIPNLLTNCDRIKPPLNKAALEEVENLLKEKEVAAFIMEPVICNLGVLIPEAEFMHGLQALCRHYGTLLIMDEVATGFGRTGKLFASEHFDIEPDIMCMAKALSGGYAAIGATIATEEVARSAEDKGMSFWSTYGWHPLSVAAALANLHYIVKHNEQIFANIASLSGMMEERLSAMPFKHTPHIRAKGLAIAADIGSPQQASALKESCRKAGLIISSHLSSLVFFPALNMDKQIAAEGLDLLEDAVNATISQRRKAG